MLIDPAAEILDNFCTKKFRKDQIATIVAHTLEAILHAKCNVYMFTPQLDVQRKSLELIRWLSHLDFNFGKKGPLKYRHITPLPRGYPLLYRDYKSNIAKTFLQRMRIAAAQPRERQQEPNQSEGPSTSKQQKLSFPTPKDGESFPSTSSAVFPVVTVGSGSNSGETECSVCDSCESNNPELNNCDETISTTTSKTSTPIPNVISTNNSKQQPMNDTTPNSPAETISSTKTSPDATEQQELISRVELRLQQFEETQSILESIDNDSFKNVQTLDDIREMCQRIINLLEIFDYDALKEQLIDLKYTRNYYRIITTNTTEQINVISSLLSVLIEYNSVSIKTKMMLEDDHKCARLDLEEALTRERQSFIYTAFTNYAKATVSRMNQLCTIIIQCLKNEMPNYTPGDNKQIKNDLGALRAKHIQSEAMLEISHCLELFGLKIMRRLEKYACEITMTLRKLAEEIYELRNEFKLLKKFCVDCEALCANKNP